MDRHLIELQVYDVDEHSDLTDLQSYGGFFMAVRPQDILQVVANSTHRLVYYDDPVGKEVVTLVTANKMSDFTTKY